MMTDQLIPDILLKRADEMERYYKNVYPGLAPLVKPCFLNTIETTVKQLEDGSYFVITGDIPAMWLRDSAAQVRPYVKYAARDQRLDEIIRGIIRKQFDLVLMDSYANAFNESLNGLGHQDRTRLHPGVWERKYEVDSLCAPFYLAYEYWKQTGNTDIFEQDFPDVVRAVLQVFCTEQNHGINSSYYFERSDCVETDTLPMEGRGNPVAPCGMTWSGFRPSDDRCVYGYLVPANMMAVRALEYGADLLTAIDSTAYEELAESCRRLASEIGDGIKKHGIVRAPDYGEIYAYETDGMGHAILMDDANSPSLLAIPYLDYASKDDALYQNTRAWILSEKNPYYYKGGLAEGMGSPHTPKGYVWCIGIIMRALTSADRQEIFDALAMLERTHAGTGYMHESFDPDEPEHFTRPWFAWANTLFAELLDKLMENGFFYEGTEQKTDKKV